MKLNVNGTAGMLGVRFWLIVEKTSASGFGENLWSESTGPAGKVLDGTPIELSNKEGATMKAFYIYVIVAALVAIAILEYIDHFVAAPTCCAGI